MTVAPAAMTTVEFPLREMLLMLIVQVPPGEQSVSVLWALPSSGRFPVLPTCAGGGDSAGAPAEGAAPGLLVVGGGAAGEGKRAAAGVGPEGGVLRRGNFWRLKGAVFFPLRFFSRRNR